MDEDDAAALMRGVSYPGVGATPYPRADPADAERLPADIWRSAAVPAGVRLELVGDAAAIDISYHCATGELGYRGPGAGTTFAVWTAQALVDEREAVVGEGRVRLELGRHAAGARRFVYLPEGMRPTVRSVAAVDGEIRPAPALPRWVAYGDSITEGWSASAPALSWPAAAARAQRLDVVNLGYAGAARAEIVTAEEISALPADIISIAVGTNCWNRIPHSAALMREQMRAFLAVVRDGHATTPIVVVSPVVRPDAEVTPNRLGATLQDLRSAIEAAVGERLGAGDDRMTLVPGADLIRGEHLVDGVHPGDEGHRLIAAAVSAALKSTGLAPA